MLKRSNSPKFLQGLQARAELYRKIRQFFEGRGVLEVETPLLMPSTNPAPFIDNFVSEGDYLQSSPEFAMKRLLAAGSGDIYQICKAFRKEEAGAVHQPEFTILEWYRCGFTLEKLMEEVSALLKSVMQVEPAIFVSYAELCERYLKIDIHAASLEQLKKVAQRHQLDFSAFPDELDVWQELLFTHLIEPTFDPKVPTFVYGYPVAQAMLAEQKEQAGQMVAERFELYFHGMELANGFKELRDVGEQRKRFVLDLEARKRLHLAPIPLDEAFLRALPKLPDCAGVALGIDRLLLAILSVVNFDEILPFRRDEVI